MQWTVLIPMKSLPEAKSRLAGASADSAAHRRLVEAIRADTLSAVRASEGVARLVLVRDRRSADADSADSAELSFVQTAPGLNAALAEAAADAVTRWPAEAIAALVGDLPALRPAELAAVLTAAAAHPHAYVPDAAGTGTTLLTATPGNPLRPQFGAGSAVRHSRSAVPLDAGAGVRCDVDTREDLIAATRLGLGACTARAVATAGVRPAG